MPVLVSVIVPSLNRAPVIRAALDSILMQDYAAIECVVLDGGSTDGTLEILRSYGERIRWTSEPDLGQADAINRGLRSTGGEICTWLNADDIWWGREAVSRVVEAFAADDEVDVIYGDCGAVDNDGRAIGDAYVVPQWDFNYVVEHADHCIAQPASFIRRRALERVSYIDPRKIFMDWDLWLRIGLSGKFRHIPVRLAAARDHEGHWHGRYTAAANEWVETLRTALGDPRMPSRLRDKRRTCLANAYLRAMQYQWMGHNLGKTLRLGLLAAWQNPGVLPDALHMAKRVIGERFTTIRR